MELCNTCKREVHSEKFEGATLFNGFGTLMLGKAGVCRECQSFVMTKFIAFFYLPLIPWKSFRGFQLPSGEFDGNRVDSSPLYLDLLFYIVWFLISGIIVLKLMGKF